jgi:Trypsin
MNIAIGLRWRYSLTLGFLLTNLAMTEAEPTISRESVKAAANQANQNSQGKSEAFVQTFTAALASRASLDGTLGDPLSVKRHNFILWPNKPKDLLYASPHFFDLYQKLVQQSVMGVQIVGGREAKVDEFETCVAVGNDKGYFCSGTLVSKRLVITAGHCAKQNPSRILIGESVFDGGKEYHVKNGGVFPHNDYQPGRDTPPITT